VTDPFDLDGQNPWRTVSSRIVFDDGRLRLRDDEVIQPDREPGRYAYLEAYWPVVVVVPVDAELNVYLVRQWRYAWQCNSWEIPAGTAEAGESPLQSAKRELAEEVGLRAEDWAALGSGFISATLDVRYHLYLARELSPVKPEAHQRDGAEHDLIARSVPLSEAVNAAMDGRIEHGLSVVGLLRAARRLGV
jgi:8-oxo-dGTP pyrophosphatase MutT (NUDIX family)